MAGPWAEPVHITGKPEVKQEQEAALPSKVHSFYQLAPALKVSTASRNCAFRQGGAQVFKT